MELKKLLSGIKTTNHEIISYRYHNIVRTINQEYWGINSDSKNCRYVGSYGRGTAIKGFSDIDIIVKLPISQYERFSAYSSNGQSALLQNVKKALNYSYSRSDIKGDGQVIVIEFSDQIKFEIVPAFELEANVLTYPDSNNNGKWKQCNPIKEIEAINVVNKYHNGLLKELCKLTRLWKRTNEVNISGVLIDTLASHFMLEREKGFLNHELLFAEFLLYMYKQKDEKTWFILGSKDIIERKDMRFEDKALDSVDDLLDAIKLNQQGNEYRVKDNLVKLFGKALVS
ncbi:MULTISPECIES: SMODS domain-containing nucleotidyltransferase [Streptomyces]|uniref:SMODS domain-containing nucleotidyltransferase n=1 Tax=Streptomyces TaxID=1883 RepID=UPI00331AA66A